MTKIAYRRRAANWHDLITVENERGIATTFGDHLAYTAFVEGLAALRKGGCDITLFDSDGTLLVGDFSDPANRVTQEE